MFSLLASRLGRRASRRPPWPPDRCTVSSPLGNCDGTLAHYLYVLSVRHLASPPLAQWGAASSAPTGRCSCFDTLSMSGERRPLHRHPERSEGSGAGRPGPRSKSLHSGFVRHPAPRFFVRLWWTQNDRRGFLSPSSEAKGLGWGVPALAQSLSIADSCAIPSPDSSSASGGLRMAGEAFCHPERSEGSGAGRPGPRLKFLYCGFVPSHPQILRFAQNDTSRPLSTLSAAKGRAAPLGTSRHASHSGVSTRMSSLGSRARMRSRPSPRTLAASPVLSRSPLSSMPPWMR